MNLKNTKPSGLLHPTEHHLTIAEMKVISPPSTVSFNNTKGSLDVCRAVELHKLYLRSN
jgi:hypothetical protein